MKISGRAAVGYLGNFGERSSKDFTSPPEFFANYAVGIRIYNVIRPQESYIIHHLFFDSDDAEGPYVAALVKSCPNGAPWLLMGTMRMIKLASSHKQFFVPSDK